ncbi:hypothetical protein C0Q70_13794 [Pomacea canaliculata]|uniref:ABC transporter domain-containing protein n=1 Tax=Pomacea canaliculata TaxID=400727 RepID=A0A2T7NY91_POMCA|nr:hypothetical protein C0Q70_13794 [Pomacea canaliculata]
MAASGEPHQQVHNTLSLKSGHIAVHPEPKHPIKEPHQAIDVHVEKLSYQVPRHPATWWQHKLGIHSLLPTRCVDGCRVVLDNVTFTVRSGQMLAILGSSGSGKTSLLDVMACRNKTGEVTGEVLLNGVPRTSAMLNACAAYVRQDDRLMATLTVRETLMFVAQLKLPKTFSKEETKARVDSVISELGLVEAADTRVGSAEVRGVSGGERRRVSIGIQMLIDPSEFRSNIFELFDLVMLLSGGRMVYFGKASNMVSYFTRLNYPCPELTNPCDYYVDLTTIDPTSDETERTSKDVVRHFQQAFHLDDPSEVAVNSGNDVSSSSLKIKASIAQAHDVEAAMSQDHFPGLQRQFSVLFRRWMLSEIEDYPLLAIRCAQALAMSVMLGVVYWQMHPDQKTIRDHFGLLYMISVMYPYLIIIDIIESCFKERRLLYFESQDNLYSIEAYYFAKIASDLPFHSLYVTLYILPVYLMANMPLDPAVFFQVFAMVYLSVLCSRGLAMMSASLLPTFQASAFFAQTFFSLFIMSAGFFINLENILSEFKWISVISYLRWGFQGLCMAEIRPLNFTCEGEAMPGTCVHDGGTALEMYSFGDGSTWQALTALGASLVVFLGIKFVALKLVPQTPEEHS